MQQTIGRSHQIRQSGRILVVPNQSQMLPQPMDIENDGKVPCKPARCNSKRTFGTNLVNCVSRNSLSKAATRPGSPEKTHRITKLTVKEQDPELLEPVVTLPIGLNEILPYQQIIVGYLECCENYNDPPSDFMIHQSEVNEQMRAILINWIVDVHEKFRLRTETLFLTVHLIDSFLSREVIHRSELQLLGISSLFMACKYEEVMVPELRKFVEVCDGAYKNSELLEMESRVLLALQFNLSATSAMTQVEHKIFSMDLSPEVVSYCSFILQLCLLDYRMCRFKPNLMALSAIYLSNKILNTRRVSSSVLLQRYSLD